jgi:hypothetical protein
MTSTADGTPHIWRQRFPDGKPEQITSGPTEEEGIAMVQDGRSFITAVALRNTSLWVHDAKGERGISVEGNAAQPRFTPDGKKLLYRIVKHATNEYAWYRDPGGIEVADLESGRSETVASGFRTIDYDISSDGQHVVMQVADKQGKQRIWYVPMDRSSTPRQIPDVEGVSPRFGPDGDVFFRHYEATGNPKAVGSVYRVRPDGTGLRKAFDTPVLLMGDISPDGHWLQVWAPLPSGDPAQQLLPLDGGSPILLGGNLGFKWSSNGSAVSIAATYGIIPVDRSYLISLPHGQIIPPIPADGFTSEAQVASLPGAQRLDARSVVPGPSPGVYAFFRGATQRNLYRIPIR